MREPIVLARRSRADFDASIHEASHAVVAHVLGLPFHHVVVGLSLARGSRGCVSIANEWMRARDIAIMCLAGREGEKRANGGCDITHDGDWQDREQAREAVAIVLKSPIGSPDVDVAIEALREEAGHLVEIWWPQIVRVAAALRRHRRLDAAAVAALCVATGSELMKREN